MFFVPSLVLLPLSFGPGSVLTPPSLLRLSLLTLVGFELSLRATARLASLLPPRAAAASGEEADNKPPKTKRTVTGPALSSSSKAPSASFSSGTQACLSGVALASGLCSLALTRLQPAMAASVPGSLLRAVFTAATTLAAYVTGARMPRSVSTTHRQTCPPHHTANSHPYLGTDRPDRRDGWLAG